MARLKNIVSAKVKGNTGAVAFRRRTDAIIVAERSYTNSAKADNATATQRIHRLRWTNVVEFYNSIKPILKRAWEGPVSQLTSWNHFTKANLSTSPVFLTKQEAALHAAVIAPYIVSRGRLTPVKGEYDQGRFLTNIKLGQSADLSTMSVADFAAAIIANNDGWQYGDKLSICRLQQLKVTKSGMRIPKIAASYLEISLDPTDSSPVSSVVGWSIFAPIVGESQELIITIAGDAAFGIHSRLSNGMLFVSAQDVVLRDPESSIYQKYSGADQLASAMDSYGYRSFEPLVEQREKPPIVPKFYDYLENDGIAYVDCGVILKGGSTLVIDYEYKADANTPRIFGVENSYQNRFFLSTVGLNLTGGIRIYVSDGVYTSEKRGYPGRNLLVVDANQITVNENEHIPYTPLAQSTLKNCFAFTVNASTIDVSKARIFSLKIWDNGDIVRSFRPCTYDGAPGLWDEVSETLFGNAADEGAFTVGNLE